MPRPQRTRLKTFRSKPAGLRFRGPGNAGPPLGACLLLGFRGILFEQIEQWLYIERLG